MHDARRSMNAAFWLVAAIPTLAGLYVLFATLTGLARRPRLRDVPVSSLLRLVTAVGALAFSLASATAARCTGRSVAAPWWPAGFLATAFMSLRAGVIGARVGGIEWRGVVYPSRVLAERQRVKV